MTSTPVDNTPVLNDSISEGVVNRTSPLKAILALGATDECAKALPKFSTTSGEKSSETFPLMSYSRICICLFHEDLTKYLI